MNLQGLSLPSATFLQLNRPGQTPSEMRFHCTGLRGSWTQRESRAHLAQPCLEAGSGKEKEPGSHGHVRRKSWVCQPCADSGRSVGTLGSLAWRTACETWVA